MLKPDVYVEVNGVQTDIQVLTETIKDIWKNEGNLMKDMKMLEVYFKPDEKMCYYVVNGEHKGQFEVNQ